MTIAVLGATGFTGRQVVKLLRDAGIPFRCLVRNRALLPDHIPPAAVVEGSLEDDHALNRVLEGADCMLSIVSLGFGHAPALVNAAERATLRRAVFISTTAIFTTLNAASKSVRVAAEKTIEQSKLQYTILRPTMIYGTHGDRNMSRLIRFVNRYPIVPVVGSGEYLQQPVYVEDVARAVVSVANNDRAARHSYNIPGATALTYNEVIDTVASALRRRVWKLHVPLRPAVYALRATEKLKLRLPIKSEQLLRLSEDKAFDYASARADFAYAPITFAEGIEREVREMGLSR